MVLMSYIFILWYPHIYITKLLPLINWYNISVCTSQFSKVLFADMYELLDFQPSLLIFCLAACFIVVYTCNYYMVLLHIIFRRVGVIGPNSGIVPM